MGLEPLARSLRPAFVIAAPGAARLLGVSGRDEAGKDRLRRMALGGEVFVAPEALSLGIVDRVVETGKGFAEAKAWAEKMAERGPLATEATKMMIAIAEGEESAASTEALASGFIALTGDLKAGVDAFRGKQKPDFSRA